MNLRPYQVELVGNIKLALDVHRRVLATLPTGGGKTVVALALARELGGRLLVVSERKTLVHQWEPRIFEGGLGPVAILQGENTHYRGTERTILGTIQTIARRGTPDDVKVVIVDEAHLHHVAHTDLFDQVGDAYVIGLTATPLREDLGKHYRTIVRGPTTRELTDLGYLVPARAFAPKADELNRALGQIELARGDFKESDLSLLMRRKAIVGDVVSTWQLHAPGRPTIAFAVDIAASKELCEEFLTGGIPAEHIDAYTDDVDRAAMFDRLRDGTTKVLCSVAVVGIGFDLPVVSCAILARPTLSLALHVQQIGRILRPAPGKVDALILDHACNVLRHGPPVDFEPPTSLDELDRHSDRKSRQHTSDCFPCPQCSAVMSPGQRECHECGHALRRKPQWIRLDGRLYVVGEDEDPAAVVAEHEGRCRFFQELRYYRDQVKPHYKPGWPAALYRERYEEWPPFAWNSMDPLPLSPATSRWIKSRQIAYARRQAADLCSRAAATECES